MKLHNSPLVFLLFILWANGLNAQHIYAPAGAEWYNKMLYGAYHSYVKGDTVINGTSCRIVSQEAMYFPASPGTGYIVDPPRSTFYVYDTEDTVFLYNTLFHHFTPIFVFNVNAGDTVQLPLAQPQGCRALHPAVESFFKIIIDSVAMVDYGNMALLKTVYSHTIQTGAAYEQWSINNTNVYAERLGSLTSNILPNCMNCGQCLSVAHTMTPDSLFCYHDGQYQVNLTSGPCNNGATGIATIAEAYSDIHLYPNPAQDKIYITNNTGYKISGISIQSVAGITIKIPEHITNQVSTEHLPDGMYFLNIRFNNGYNVVKPVTVIH